MERVQLTVVLRELFILGASLEKAAPLAGCCVGTAYKLRAADERASGRTWRSLRAEAAAAVASPLACARFFRDNMLRKLPGLRGSFKACARDAATLHRIQELIDRLADESRDPQAASKEVRAFTEWLAAPGRVLPAEDRDLESANLAWFRQRWQAFIDRGGVPRVGVCQNDPPSSERN